MSGLFEKALSIRANSSDPSANGEFVFDESSGISKEDQKDILGEIETIATENRIKVSPEVFRIKAIKRGVLFPIIINVAAVIVMAVGITTLLLLFRRGEEQLMESAAAISTAEGKLLEELKRESSEQLKEKDSEISAIQNQLASIEQDRQKLQATMEGRIRDREEELRQALEAELQAEKGRLEEQGLSQEDIDAKIAALETQKQGEFQSELEEFRAEAEEERLRAEENLRRLQEDYNASLAEINAERARIEAEARARERELQSKLDERQQALETEKTEAEQQLKNLEQQREKEELVDTQLIGFYNTVKTSLKDEKYDDALATLASLRDYLDEDTVVTLPGIQKRREVEFFVIDSLSNLIEGEMSKEVVDTTSLLQAAEGMTQVKNKVTQADRSLELGESAKAEALYREALALIPEIRRSHEYLTGRSTTEENARLGRLEESLGKSEAAFAAGDYAGALDSFTSALAYLPLPPETVQALVGRVRTAGYQLEAAQRRARDSERAAQALEAADALQRQGRYRDALSAYADVVAGYPAGRQVPAALQGIRDSARGALTAAEEQGRQLEEALAQKEEELQEKEQELAASSAALLQGSDTLQQEKEALEEERDALLIEKETLERERDALLERRDALVTENAALLADRDTLTAEKETVEQERDDLQEQNASLQAELAGLQVELEKRVEAAESEQVQALRETIGELESEKTAVEQTSRVEIRQLQSDLARLTDERDALSEERDGLIEERDSLTAALEEARRPGTGRERDRQEIERLNAEIEKLNGEIAGLNDKLGEALRRFASLESRYAAYVREESRLKDAKGEIFGLLESKVYLNEFLTSVEEVFPGLYDRIAQYDKAYEKAGRLTAIDEITNLFYDLDTMDSLNDQLRYLSEEKIRYRDDPDMLAVLDELEAFLKR